MSEFKFSVVIPAYNAGNFLKDALESVLNQTYPFYEIIIIDDGSTDSTKILVQRFEDNRIKYHYQNNRGPSKARNEGILQAKGDWIAFLDADDLWLENHLEDATTVLLNDASLKWFCCAYQVQNRNIEIKKIIQNPDRKIVKFFSEQLKTSFICTPTVIIKKEVFNEIGTFNERWKFGEDLNMWFRIGLSYPLVGYSKNIGCVVRRIEGSATSDKSNYNLMDSFRVVYFTDIENRFSAEKESLLLIHKWIENLFYNAFFEGNKKILLLIKKKWWSRCSYKVKVFLIIGLCFPKVLSNYLYKLYRVRIKFNKNKYLKKPDEN